MSRRAAQQHAVSQDNTKRVQETKNVAIPSEDVKKATILRNNKDLAMQPAYIDTMRWKVLSFEEMEKMKVVEVTNIEANKPEDNSLADRKMGSYKSRGCTTCYVPNCGGHHGIIYFTKKFLGEGKEGWRIDKNQTLDNKSVLILNPLFIRPVIYILSSVCMTCSRLIMSEENISQMVPGSSEGIGRLSRLAEATGTSRLCRFCKTSPKPYVFETKTSEEKNIVHYKEDKSKVPMKTIDVFNILTKMTESDVKLLKLGPGIHPRDFVLRALLVIPPSARPPNYRDGHEEQDSFTKVYSDIIKAMNGFQNGKTGHTEIQNYLINKIKEIHRVDSKKTGRGAPARTFHNIFLGKKGIFRMHVQTGRTGLSIRAVLGPGPDLEFGYIGVPEKYASELTVNEFVTVWNLPALEKLANQGKITRIILRGYTDPAQYRGQKLSIGDQVFRHLQNGDLFVFNRQPVLQRQSQLGYRVILIKGDTIRLHLSNTTGHNADFDGDEGNGVLVVDLLAKSEALHVMNTSQCVISSQDSRPAVGLVVDAITSAFLLTSGNNPLPTKVFNACTNLLTNRDGLSTLVERSLRYGIHPLSGKALFSSLLPEDFYYKKGDVEIVNGILINGAITKDHIGTAENSIIHVLSKQYPSKRRDEFITDATYVLNHYIAERGFTIGLEDCIPGYKEEYTKTLDPGQAMVKALESISAPLEKQLKESESILYQAMKERQNPLLAEAAESKIVEVANTLTAKSVRLIKDRIVGPHTIVSELVPSLKSKLNTQNLSPNDIKDVIAGVNKIFALTASLRRSLASTDDEFEIETNIMEKMLKKWSELLNVDPTEYKESYVTLMQEYINDDITVYEYDRAVKEIVTISRASLDDVIDKMRQDVDEIKTLQDEVKLRRSIIATTKISDDDFKVMEDIQKEVNTGDLSHAKMFLEKADVILPLFSAPENAIAVMASKIGAGTKGEVAGAAKIAGSFGQMYYGGEMIHKGKKCYPSVDLDDPSIKAHGYITNNLIKGLEPTEYSGMMAGGRQGLVDTADKTKRSGDLHHRINRDFENIYINYQGMAVNEYGMIISYCYGNDGFEASEIVNANDKSGGYHLPVDITNLAHKYNAMYGWVPKSAVARNPLAKEEKATSLKPLVKPSQRINPYERVTKFEKAAAIKERAKQLAANHLPFVPVDLTRTFDVIDIATEEFDKRLMPITIVRESPNGDVKEIYLGTNLEAKNQNERTKVVP